MTDGPGMCEPVVWNEGAGVGAGSRGYLHTDRTRILSGGPLSDSERAELLGKIANWESGNCSDCTKTPQERFFP